MVNQHFPTRRPSAFAVDESPARQVDSLFDEIATFTARARQTVVPALFAGEDDEGRFLWRLNRKRLEMAISRLNALIEGESK